MDSIPVRNRHPLDKVVLRYTRVVDEDVKLPVFVESLSDQPLSLCGLGYVGTKDGNVLAADAHDLFGDLKGRRPVGVVVDDHPCRLYQARCRWLRRFPATLRSQVRLCLSGLFHTKRVSRLSVLQIARCTKAPVLPFIYNSGCSFSKTYDKSSKSHSHK